METSTVLAIIAGAIVAFFILRRLGESKPVDPMEAMSGTKKPDVQHIVQLLLAGKKVEAIKAYMEMSGTGLEEARNAIERYDPILKRLEIPPSPPSFDSIDDWTEIDALLEDGRKIEAIKLYREKTGCDLKEAKDAIDIRDNPS